MSKASFCNSIFFSPDRAKAKKEREVNDDGARSVWRRNIALLWSNERFEASVPENCRSLRGSSASRDDANFLDRYATVLRRSPVVNTSQSIMAPFDNSHQLTGDSSRESSNNCCRSTTILVVHRFSFRLDSLRTRSGLFLYFVRRNEYEKERIRLPLCFSRSTDHHIEHTPVALHLYKCPRLLDLVHRHINLFPSVRDDDLKILASSSGLSHPHPEHVTVSRRSVSTLKMRIGSSIDGSRVSSFLRSFPLLAEESDRGDLMEAKWQLFLQSFTLLMNLLTAKIETRRHALRWWKFSRRLFNKEQTFDRLVETVLFDRFELLTMIEDKEEFPIAMALVNFVSSLLLIAPLCSHRSWRRRSSRWSPFVRTRSFGRRSTRTVGRESKESSSIARRRVASECLNDALLHIYWIQASLIWSVLI